MNSARYTDLTEELRVLMDERLAVKAATFPAAVRKAGRLLPGPARAAARELIAMEQRLSHPKLAARTDPAQIEQAGHVMRTALNRRRAGARKGQQRSLLAAEIGFRLLLLVVAALALVQIIGAA